MKKSILISILVSIVVTAGVATYAVTSSKAQVQKEQLIKAAKSTELKTLLIEDIKKNPQDWSRLLKTYTIQCSFWADGSIATKHYINQKKGIEVHFEVKKIYSFHDKVTEEDKKNNIEVFLSIEETGNLQTKIEGKNARELQELLEKVISDQQAKIDAVREESLMINAKVRLLTN